MFFKRRNKNELDPPPMSTTDEQPIEILRVWTGPDSPLQLTLRTNWKDPAAWGLTLVDVARHAANAYEKEGRDRDVALKRIREAFDAEWFNPTDTPKDITQAS